MILYRMVSDGGAAGPAGPSATDTSSRRPDDATAAADDARRLHPADVISARRALRRLTTPIRGCCGRRATPAVVDRRTGGAGSISRPWHHVH